MSAEMAAHLEMQEATNRAAGMSPEEAHYAAQRQFGGVDQIKETCRDQRGWWGWSSGQDVWFAVRSLCRAHNFSLAVLGTLVVGIGRCDRGFRTDFLDRNFLSTLPQPEQLFLIGFKDKQSSSNAYRSAMHLQAYQEQVNAFLRVCRGVGRVSATS